MFKKFSAFLCLIITLNAAVFPTVHAQVQGSNSGSDPVGQTIAAVQTEVDAALVKTPGLTEPTETGSVPETRSRHLNPYQFHRVYGEDGRMIGEYDLARIDITNPGVELANPAKELHFVYSETRRELEIQRVVYDPRLKRERLTDGHVFKNITLTSNIIVDGAMGYFATADGLHSFLVKHLQASFGKKILVTPVVLVADPSTAMTGLRFFTQEVKPEPIHADFIDDGDLLITFASGRVERINRAETILNLGSNLMGMMAMVQAANPDMDGLELYQKIFAENAQDLAQFFEAQRALVDGPENDLVNHALRAWGQKLDYNELGLLFEKNSQGQNQFQSLSQAPRNRVSPQTWSRNYQIIQAGQADDIRADRAPRSWKQILIDHYTGKDVNAEEAKEAAKKAMSLRKKIFNRITAFWARHVTKTRLANTAIALTAVGVDQAFFGGAGAHWVFHGAVQMLNWSADVPLLGNLTGPIAKSIGFFTDASQRWGIARLVAGTAAVMALNPLSYGITKIIANRAKKDWSAVRAFFTYGTRAYAAINYPIQKLLVWDRLRQKGLYSAVVQNNVDPLKNGLVFNSPFASNEQIANRAERLNNSLEADAVRKGRALVLAAAIVSEAQSQNGNPIDIATLLLASESPSATPAQLMQQLGDVAGNARWSDLTHQVYRGLVAMGDEGGSVSRAQLKEYVQLYQRLALRFKQESDSGLKVKLRTLARRSRNLMSKNVLPMLAYGKQWYEVYQRYSNVTLSDETLEMAKHGYNEDYQTSAVIYALADPKKFADIPILGLGGPEVVTNQLSQVFVYGVQGAIDPPNPKEALKNPYEPLTNDIYSASRTREQTVGEGLGAIVRGAGNPEAGSFFGQHASVMEKLFEGFQVRFLADFVTRSVGLYLTMTLLGEAPNALETVLKSVQLSTFFLMAKISFQFGAGGFIPGYATIWPYIQMSMSHMQGSASANLKRIQLADFLFTTGEELQDLKMVQDGAELMKSLYAEGKKTLPEKYNIAPEAYDFSLAKELHQYSLAKGNVPLPTLKSTSLYANVNRFGALVSTVLFAGVSAVAMDPNSNATELLVKALAWFGVTYGVMKTAATVAPTVQTFVKTKIVEPIKGGIGYLTETCNRRWRRQN